MGAFHLKLTSWGTDLDIHIRVQSEECTPVKTQSEFSLEAYISKPWFVQQQQPITVRPTHPNSIPFAPRPCSVPSLRLFRRLC